MKSTADDLDTLTRRHTGFMSFAELITTPEYFPTLIDRPLGRGMAERIDCAERAQLAGEYDAEMCRRGDSRRAWRGFVSHQLASHQLTGEKDK